jgi:hypothetical protein
MRKSERPEGVEAVGKGRRKRFGEGGGDRAEERVNMSE